MKTIYLFIVLICLMLITYAGVPGTLIEEYPNFTGEQLPGNDLDPQLARDMITKYLVHDDAIKVKIKMNEEDSIVPLNGFKIDIKVLREIIDTEEGEPNPDVSAIYIMPAVRPCDLENEPKDQYFTIIVGGLRDDNTLIEDNLKEYFDPCPTRCPNVDILENIYPAYPEAILEDCE